MSVIFNIISIKVTAAFTSDRRTFFILFSTLSSCLKYVPIKSYIGIKHLKKFMNKRLKARVLPLGVTRGAPAHCASDWFAETTVTSLPIFGSAIANPYGFQTKACSAYV